MSDNRPPEEISKELMLQAEDLVSKAERRLERQRELLSTLGVTEDQVRNYLKRHDVPPGNQQLVELQSRVLDEQARKELREERQAKKGNKPRGMGRRGTIRI